MYLGECTVMIALVGQRTWTGENWMWWQITLILVWGRWKEENWSLRTVWTGAKVFQNNWAGRTYCTCEKQLEFGWFLGNDGIR